VNIEPYTGWSRLLGDPEPEADTSAPLVRALTALWEARDRAAIAQVACRAAREIVAADGAALLVAEGEGGRVIGEDAIAPLWKGPRRERFSGWHLQQDRPVVLEDGGDELEDYRGSFIEGVTLVPVRGRKTRGALACHWAGPGAASRAQLDSLETLARATAGALEANDEREELAPLASQREAAREDARSFLAALSHGMRTPVAQVIGFAQLLHDERATLVPGHRVFVDEIIAAARQANVVIDEVGKLARLVHAELVIGAVDLATIAGEVATALMVRHGDRRIEWEITRPLEGRGDPRLVRPLLEHLLANAVKFTAGKDPARITVGAAEGAFFVRDNGVGFDPRQQARLFTPFGCLHAREQFPGVGLGLVTCRRIVERHGGRTWADSNPDRGGATFFFTLAA
jgi:chemotaxis family two-component system sensor kinase Cph1